MKLIRKYEFVAKTQSHSRTRNVTCFAIYNLTFWQIFLFLNLAKYKNVDYRRRGWKILG